MGLPIQLHKEEETATHCTYAFRAPGDAGGRATLQKDTGDVELLDLEPASSGPDERYVLAQVVPRLHSYHERAAYPDSDQWEA